MKLRGLSFEQKLILNLLYELRNTTMTPPDPRLSLSEIAKTFGMTRNTVAGHLKELTERGFVFPFRVGRKELFKITMAGIYEVEKCISTTIEGELSTSKIGVKGVRKRANG